MPKIKGWGHRKDGNHAEILGYFEDMKCKIKDVSGIPGFCDLIVKRGSQVRFVEIKDPTKVPSQRKLTKDEKEFHDYWGGVEIVETFADVVDVVNRMGY